MSYRKSAMAGVAALALAGAAQAVDIQYGWKSAISGDWTDPARWQPEGVPDTTAEHARIAAVSPAAVQYTVTADTDLSVGKVTIDSPQATLSILHAVTFKASEVDLSSGTIRVSPGGMLRVVDERPRDPFSPPPTPLVFHHRTGGMLALGGTLRLETIDFRQEGGAFAGEGRVLLYNSALTHAAAHPDSSPTFVFRSSGTFRGADSSLNFIPSQWTVVAEASNESTSTRHLSLVVPPEMANRGTLRLTSVDGDFAVTLTSPPNLPLERFTNLGTLSVEQGPLGGGLAGATSRNIAVPLDNAPSGAVTFGASTNVTRPVINAGSMTIAQGKVVTLNNTGPTGFTLRGGTLRLQGDGGAAGAGTLRLINTGFRHEGGAIEGPGVVELYGSALSFALAPEQPGSGTFVYRTSGQISFPIPAGAKVVAEASGLPGGSNLSLATLGDLVNNSTLTLRSVGGNFRVTLNGYDEVEQEVGTLTNNGRLEVQPGAASPADRQFTIHLLNAPMGTAVFDAPAQLNYSARNEGRMNVGAGVTVLARDGFTQAAGDLHVGGTLAVGTNRTFTFDGGTMSGGGRVAFDSFAGTLVNNAPVDQPAGGNFVFGRVGSIKAGAAGRAAILPGQTVFVAPPGADEAWFDVAPGFTNHGTLVLESALPGTPINLSTSGGAGGIGTLTNAGVLRIMPAPLQSITPHTPTNRFIYGNLVNTQTGAVTVSSPTALRGDLDNDGALTVSPNAVLTVSGRTRNTGNLAVNAGAKVIAEAPIHDTGRIALGASDAEPTGTLDVKEHALVHQAADPAGRDAALARFTSLLKAGRRTSNIIPPRPWGGRGITSSAAFADVHPQATTVGIAPNTRDDAPGPFYTQFAGFDVDENAVLLRYTYNGDADLSGEVNADDYARADRGFLSQVDADPANNAAGFHNGDFNYDERINISDFFLLDLGHALQGEPLGINPPAEGLAAAVPSAAASPVPEPGSILVLAAAAAMMARRRTRFAARPLYT